MVRLRLLVPILLLTSSVAAWAGFIRGQVHYDNGNPADHVIIRLTSGMIAYQNEMTTDPEGKFNFDGLSLSTYHLTVEGQGFKPYSSNIDISMSKMAYEQITLHLNKDPEPKAVPPGGPKEQLNVRVAQIPSNARKEFEAGKKSMQEQNAAASMQHFQKAIELYPKYAEAYQLLAVLHMESGNLADAEPELVKATDIEPNLATAHFALGVCRNAMAKFADAEPPLKHGLDLDPDSVDGNYELAKTYFALGRWQDAEPHALRSERLKPEFAPAHALMGDILIKKRDGMAALKEFKEYLRLDPKGQFAPGANDMVARIEKAMGGAH